MCVFAFADRSVFLSTNVKKQVICTGALIESSLCVGGGGGGGGKIERSIVRSMVTNQNDLVMRNHSAFLF